MSIERSNGKARPTLPRASDLRRVQSAGNPTEGRDDAGRFAPGNRVSMGARWKNSVKRLLGRGASEETASGVARQAWGLYLAVMRDMPSDGTTVRMLAALQARHAALAAYFTDRAGELGLDTPAGTAALERATKDGQRAERLAVTALDVATKLAEAKPRSSTALPAWLVADVDAGTESNGDERSDVQTTSASSDASERQPDGSTGHVGSEGSGA